MHSNTMVMFSIMYYNPNGHSLIALLGTLVATAASAIEDLDISDSNSFVGAIGNSAHIAGGSIKVYLDLFGTEKSDNLNLFYKI